MVYTADLHLHSSYAYATSKYINLVTLYQWAQIKGIDVIGTGDFTHPAWLATLEEQLVSCGNGLFELKNPPKTTGLEGIRVADRKVYFCLSTEVSCVYRYGGRVRKSHHLIYLPDFESVKRLSFRLSKFGNLAADGRPTLRLSARDLLEEVLKISDKAYLIPAHIWTPWFSIFGSRSGYDSIEECFRDLTPHIFALETGLSSDPAMNRRVGMLDRYTLVSNSDAHSPQNLGRELNLFDTECSYDGIFEALKTKKGFKGTLEFFPEEGKYHWDGHRLCKVGLAPEDTRRYKGVCPVCRRPLTVGVLHRVSDLANRATKTATYEQILSQDDFDYIVPLPEVIGQIVQKGTKTKTVQRIYIQLISKYGNELNFLYQVPLEDITRFVGHVYAYAIDRLRQKKVQPVAGYDGQYGHINLLEGYATSTTNAQLGLGI